MSLIQDNDDFSKVLLQNFTTDEQKLFVQSFQAYLQYGNDDNAFVIDLDHVWEWLGFKRKTNCKLVLTKNFEEGKHFIINILLPQLRPQDSATWGGHNKEQVLMTVNTFKKLCMKAATKRADEVCDYYIKMERVMQQYIHQRLHERSEHILQLQHQVSQHSNLIELERHRALMDSYDGQRVVYKRSREPIRLYRGYVQSPQSFAQFYQRSCSQKYASPRLPLEVHQLTAPEI